MYKKISKKNVKVIVNLNDRNWGESNSLLVDYSARLLFVNCLLIVEENSQVLINFFNLPL